MMRPIVQLVVLFWGVSDSLVHARTNVGREFIFAYAENYRPNADPSLIITNMSPLDHEVVTVTVTSTVHGLLQTVTLQGFQSSQQVTLPREVIPVRPDLNMVTIIVEADDDVAVHAVNDAHDRSMDGFAALPVSSLGTEYFVAMYTPSIHSQIVVVAPESDTTVRVELSSTVTYKNTDVKAGDTILIDLHRREAILLNGAADLTGTRVQSNKPVAVLSGNRCAFIPVGVISCDHLVEMLTPFNQWGRKFVLVPFYGRSTGIIYRVIAGRRNTEVTINSQTITLQQRQYRDFELDVDQSDFVESDNPVQVVQFAKGFNADNVLGDPAMTIVPPVEQGVHTVKFPTYNITTGLNTVENYVNVYALCAEMYYSNLTLDGVVIRDIVPADDRIIRVDRSDYCAVGLHLAHGLHDVSQAPQGGKGLVAIAYGFAEMNSYAWPAGLSTRSITCQYVAPDGGRLDYDCNKELLIEGIPCNTSNADSEKECVGPIDCIPIDHVIYISAGVAVGAIILQKLFSHFVIERTRTPKQLAFGQLGQLPSKPPEIAIHSSESKSDMTEVDPSYGMSLYPPSVPPDQSKKTPKQERADRMRRRSRTPSPSPASRN